MFLTGDEAGSISGNAGGGGRAGNARFSQIENFILTARGDNFDARLALTSVQVDAGSGTDFVNGGFNDDSLYAGTSADTVYGNGGNDLIDGGDGSDFLDGVDGNDTVLGGAGDDGIYGNFGDDSLDGGDGDDVFGVYDTDGQDQVIGGEMAETSGDRVDMRNVTTGIFVRMTGDEAGVATYATGSVTFSQIEMLYLGAADDTFFYGSFFTGISVFGYDGNDIIIGGGGVDTIDGGAGLDTLRGGQGNDLIYGGSEDDLFLLRNGVGDDTIVGGTTGQVAGDVMDMSAMTTNIAVVLSGDQMGAATLNGGIVSFFEIEGFILSGHDDVFDASAALLAGVSVDGSFGQDLMTGGGGDDSILGGFGDDTIVGSGGFDSLDGGVKDDHFQITDTTGTTSIIGGETAETAGDFLDLSRLTFGVSLTATGVESGFFKLAGGQVSFIEIENLVLSNFSDFLDATSAQGPVNAAGGSGDDLLLGSGSADTLLGGDGNDTVDGGGGDDLIDGGIGDDLILLGDFSGNDAISGGEFKEVTGDTISLSAMTGSVAVVLTGVEDGVILTQTSTSSFTLIENLVLTGFDDVVSDKGSNSALAIYGGFGVDLITGGDGGCTLDGGDGDDVIQGGSGADVIHGGVGFDALTGGLGADVFVLVPGGDSDFILDFQIGTDLMDFTAYQTQFSNLVITTNVEDLIVQVGGESFTLFGLGNQTLSAADFLF